MAEGARGTRPTASTSDRRFVTVPPIGTGLAPPRRIWEVEAGAVLVALGVLLERHELVCASPCCFAGAVERLLDARTERVRRRVDGPCGGSRCPAADPASRQTIDGW